MRGCQPSFHAGVNLYNAPPSFHAALELTLPGTCHPRNSFHHAVASVSIGFTYAGIASCVFSGIALNMRTCYHVHIGGLRQLCAVCCVTASLLGLVWMEWQCSFKLFIWMLRRLTPSLCKNQSLLTCLLHLSSLRCPYGDLYSHLVLGASVAPLQHVATSCFSHITNASLTQATTTGKSCQKLTMWARRPTARVSQRLRYVFRPLTATDQLGCTLQ
jgi:hypothetical protein